MRTLETMTAEHITFGVELETVIPATCTFPIGGYHRGIPVMESPAFNGRHWKAERDGSIHPPYGFKRCEFISPILRGPEGVENLIRMVEWVKSVGGRVNPSCGCHIHVGLESVLGRAGRATVSEYIRKLAGVVNINATGVYAQTGTHRETNVFSRPLCDDIRRTIEHSQRDGDVSRYRYADRRRILNVTNVTSRGTVEFRAFAGTLNPDKVLHHLWTCLFMVSFAKALKRVPWTGSGWDSMQGGNGEKALRGLHRKMGRHCLVGAMAERKRAMKAEAIRLARKFDAR